MTDTELIACLAKRLEETRADLDALMGGVQMVRVLLCGIGGPLNGNRRGYTEEQLKVFFRIARALGI